jgi:hypothetical protein
MVVRSGRPRFFLMVMVVCLECLTRLLVVVRVRLPLPFDLLLLPLDLRRAKLASPHFLREPLASLIFTIGPAEKRTYSFMDNR